MWLLNFQSSDPFHAVDGNWKIAFLPQMLLDVQEFCLPYIIACGIYNLSEKLDLIAHVIYNSGTATLKQRFICRVSKL